MTSVSKTCNVCGEVKPLQAYSAHIDRCRECHNRIRRERRAAVATRPACVYCGGLFKKEHNGQKLCSPDCQKAWYRKRVGLVPVIVRIDCLECGINFQPKTSKTRFCSESCAAREKHRRLSNTDPEYVARRKSYSTWRSQTFQEEERERSRRRRVNDAERIRERSRIWAANNKYQARPSWRSRNPEKAAVRQRRRYERVKAQTPYPIDHQTVVAKLAYWGNACWVCGAPFEAVDHVKPIARGGLHIVANMRPICRRHNSQKSDRWDGPRQLFQM